MQGQRRCPCHSSDQGKEKRIASRFGAVSGPVAHGLSALWEGTSLFFHVCWEESSSHCLFPSLLHSTSTDMTDSPLPIPSHPGPFGHKQRKNFFFPEGFTQFNHGSYGKSPEANAHCIARWYLNVKLSMPIILV